jgi:hypothetical protein
MKGYLNVKLFFGWIYLIKSSHGMCFKSAQGMGPIFALCEEHKEMIYQLFVGCHFAKEVWVASITLMGGVRGWKVYL